MSETYSKFLERKSQLGGQDGFEPELEESESDA